MFRTLLSKARAAFWVGLAPGNDEEGISTYGPARDLQYRRVGIYVARHSHILLALWDGRDPQLVGGAAEIVRLKLEGLRREHAPELKPLGPPVSGPVWHIPTRRLRDGERSPLPASMHN